MSVLLTRIVAGFAGVAIAIAELDLPGGGSLEYRPRILGGSPSLGRQFNCRPNR